MYIQHRILNYFFNLCLSEDILYHSLIDLKLSISVNHLYF